MAANIPFTPSTIDYDPPRNYVLGVVFPLGSVMDVVWTKFPHVSALIDRARQHRLYTTAAPVTIFVPDSYVFDRNTLASDAITMCRLLTVGRCLDATALRYSSTFVLRTLATPYDLLVETINNETTINGSVVVETIRCTNGAIHVVRANTIPF